MAGLLFVLFHPLSHAIEDWGHHQDHASEELPLSGPDSDCFDCILLSSFQTDLDSEHISIGLQDLLVNLIRPADLYTISVEEGLFLRGPPLITV